MKALSIRQPWAFLIIHGGKDVKNRSWNTNFPGSFLVHAAKGMTSNDFTQALLYCSERGLPMPDRDDMLRGGIIGSFELVDTPDTCPRLGTRVRKRWSCAIRSRFLSPQSKVASTSLKYLTNLWRHEPPPQRQHLLRYQNARRECSALPFKAMPLIQRGTSTVIMRCSDFKRPTQP